ncbi:MAG: hypothetical protein IKG40_00955 [Bacilli bacterium]|nr:hypothetical protein [Bacilli bacterium]
MNIIKKVLLKIIDHRFIFFTIFFIICLIFKVHGSSIGFYDRIISSKIDSSKKEVLVGISRGIRSDEWMVHTPYYFSQKYNNYRKYSRQMSFSGQNMILGYNSPVKDITLIGKPFTWGYILFGNEIGLSWYWCMKLFVLILATFEFIMILTDNNKKLSLLGVFMVAFSPVLQWWFVPHITDVFIWTMILISLFYHFFTAKNMRIKLLTTFLLPCSVIGFVLALFPSCQIPLGFLSLSLLIGFLIRDKEKITFNKKEWYYLLFILLLVFCVLGYFVFTSIDDLKLFMNTVYPGSRISVGGDGNFKSLFTDLTSLFLPYKAITYLNNCEVSTFLHFGPLFMLLYFKIFNNIKGNKEHILGIILFTFIIIELFFILIGFPKILARITLFSYINRMNLIYGYTATLFTIWCIYCINKYDIKFNVIEMFFSIGIFLIIYFCTIDKSKLDFLPLYFYIFELIYFLLIILFIFRKSDVALIMICVFIIISSFPINPISTGISSITNHPSSKQIRKIINNEDGYFLVEGEPMYANYVLALGGKVINATNMYPDYKKWLLIDKSKNNEFYYNRYANMSFDLVHDNTQFNLKAPDHLYVKLSYKDLKKLKVKYVFTLRNVDDDFKMEDIKFDKIFADKQIYIYKII